MLIGVITGAYSAIFVATPILVMLKEREPKYQQHRARLEGKTERSLRPVPSTRSAEEADGEPVSEHAAVGAAAATAATVRTSARTSQPGQRPRPKSRRKPPAKRKRR